MTSAWRTKADQDLTALDIGNMRGAIARAEGIALRCGELLDQIALYLRGEPDHWERLPECAKRIDALIRSAKAVSPSKSMTVYLYDLEQACGREVEGKPPWYGGQNDGP